MATIGLSKPYYALYSASGNTVTYSSPGFLGKATELSVEIESADDNNLFADNGIAESDNQFAGGSLSITVDDLLQSAIKTVLGVQTQAITSETITTADPEWLVYNEDQVIPYVGFGGIIKKKVNGAIKYVALVLTKVQFKNQNDEATTQEDEIEWQTQALEGTIMRDDTAKKGWRYLSSLMDTEADALAAIQTILGTPQA